MQIRKELGREGAQINSQSNKHIMVEDVAGRKTITFNTKSSTQ